jgi:tRNA (guanine37-N1)-methyltransferase
MKFSVITIFPELFDSFAQCSIVARAIGAGIVSLEVANLRDYATDRHNTVDDSPYGGGPGMVMKPVPWFAALDDVAGTVEPGEDEVILLSPRGERLKQEIFEELKTRKRLIFLCGRYEDIDDRVRQRWVTREISLGDYVINGGELASQVVIEGVTRLLPGAISDPESAERDSFSSGILDHRHFTKPREFAGMQVPDVLLSGDHEKIRRWRLKDALKTTLERRPDLLQQRELTQEEQELLDQLITAGEDPPADS